MTYRVSIPLTFIGALLQFNPELLEPGHLKLRGRLMWPKLGLAIRGEADVRYDAHAVGPLGEILSRILDRRKETSK